MGPPDACNRRPTPALCLVLYVARSGAPCTSGVLQVGYDIEAEAVEASRANAQLNGVAGRCSFHLCDQEGLEVDLVSHGQFDVCIANIFQGDLLALQDTFGALVRPGGRIVMSGMLDGTQVCSNDEVNMKWQQEPCENLWTAHRTL